jgi:hypothetical protein
MAFRTQYPKSSAKAMRLTAQSIIFPTIYGYCLPSRIIYFDKGKDLKSRAAITLLKKKKDNISSHKRDAITKLMHDKFIVSYKNGREAAILMGSTNFTSEAQTIQANLLHILHSTQLADFYAQRAHLLATNPPTKNIAKSASWHEITDVAGSKIRVFFLPEPSPKRTFLETVTSAGSFAYLTCRPQWSACGGSSARSLMGIGWP